MHSPSKPLQKDIATALGISRGRVSQLKSQGMPVDSIASAEGWYRRMLRDRIGGNGNLHPAVAAAAEHLVSNPKPSAIAKPSDDDPDSKLWRARQSEIASYELLAAAYRTATESRKQDDIAVIPGLLRTHAQASRNRLEAERQWERHRLRVGAVVRLEFAQGLISSVLGPLDAQLSNLAKGCAAEANPSDPAHAERVLSEAVERLRRQVSANRAGGLTAEEVSAIFAAKRAGVLLKTLAPGDH